MFFLANENKDRYTIYYCICQLFLCLTLAQKNYNKRYLNEKYEVFKRRVEMCFFSQLNNLRKVLMIDVCINSKQTLQYCLGITLKIPGKWHTCKNRKKEY